MYQRKKQVIKEVMYGFQEKNNRKLILMIILSHLLKPNTEIAKLARCNEARKRESK